MHCTVYVLRRDGKKLPKEEIRANPLRGWLEVDRYVMGPPTRVAKLFSTKPKSFEENSLIEMWTIDLSTVRGGLLLTGFVSGQSGYAIPLQQAWWVLPDGQPQ